MAFEYIYKMVDALEKEHQYNLTKAEENYSVDPARARMHNTRADAFFQALLMYYETVLHTGKFKDQKEYGKRAIMRMNPLRAEGYFKGKK
jgi:hypothetical protein